jgi:uncharacterized protein YbaR (Trm112 family)
MTDHSPSESAAVPATLGIDPRLLEILACPCEHHQPLRVDAPAEALVCTRCATTFPVREGFPVMLLDEATPGPDGIGAGPRS